MDLSEMDLIELEGLVTDMGKWDLLKRMLRTEIDEFWERLRLTDTADTERVVANHRLAVGVESSLGSFVKKIETAVYVRRAQQDSPQIMADTTQTLLGD